MSTNIFKKIPRFFLVLFFATHAFSLYETEVLEAYKNRNWHLCAQYIDQVDPNYLVPTLLDGVSKTLAGELLSNLIWPIPKLEKYQETLKLIAALLPRTDLLQPVYISHGSNYSFLQFFIKITHQPTEYELVTSIYQNIFSRQPDIDQLLKLLGGLTSIKLQTVEQICPDESSDSSEQNNISSHNFVYHLITKECIERCKKLQHTMEDMISEQIKGLQIRDKKFSNMNNNSNNNSPNNLINLPLIPEETATHSNSNVEPIRKAHSSDKIRLLFKSKKEKINNAEEFQHMLQWLFKSFSS